MARTCLAATSKFLDRAFDAEMSGNYIWTLGTEMAIPKFWDEKGNQVKFWILSEDDPNLHYNANAKGQLAVFQSQIRLLFLWPFK